jgi:hypothetical protein
VDIGPRGSARTWTPATTTATYLRAVKHDSTITRVHQEDTMDISSPRVRSTAAVTAVLLAAGTGIAAAAPAHGSHVRHLHLVEVQHGSTQLDLGAKGFSPGDRQTITSAIDTRAGHQVGRIDDDCVITQAGARPEAVCTFTMTLPHGQLTGAFAQDLAAPDTGKRQAITGGTGRFAGARGEVRVGHEGPRTPFTIVLR